MNITVEDNERIKVTLSADELTLCKMTYADLYRKTFDTRLFLQKLFYCSKSVTNFSKQGDVLLIEIFPAILGGCTLYFTPIKQIKQEKTEPKLFKPSNYIIRAVFGDSTSLLDFAYALKNRRIVIRKSVLYKNGEGYILHLSPYLADIKNVRGLLNEFAKNFKQLSPSYRERGSISICDKNALTKITRFL